MSPRDPRLAALLELQSSLGGLLELLEGDRAQPDALRRARRRCDELVERFAAHNAELPAAGGALGAEITEALRGALRLNAIASSRARVRAKGTEESLDGTRRLRRQARLDAERAPTRGSCDVSG